ncbi:4-amino-4-deoxy-L-arabinose-phosphoundecaprenol flippase subunit ArnE [Paenibacillus konkukensis]|uniref:4-amino-4-deoxy-L-arabinose-phosphoundecaprenol flippase subunit ArnE n=1 Tax=Paenibacillus konkukensis TaxID=2020716 RepID=A0ABY4RHM2_9BACL|nr:DMT family transporter [Paenibacillus konkukensis]UQZ81530.1 4-amino-4-deoxy-L-arabinose-phosphoundecaprenol flippase subunit ArnE [Paenibacillus konkukensis]
MTSGHRSPVPLWLIFTVGIVAISCSSIIIKLSAAPVSVSGMYRLLITNVIMLPLMWKYIPEVKRLNGKDWLLLLGSGIALGLHFLLWMASLRYTTVASSTVLMTLEPIFVLVGAYFVYRERTTPTAAAGIGVAVFGAMLVGLKDFAVSGTALQGDILSLLGTVAVAVHMLLGQKLSRHISSTLYSFSVFLVAACFFAVYNGWNGIAFTGYPAKEWILFALLAVIPTVFGHILFNWSLKFVNAASVSTAVLGEPIGATLLAWMLLGESVNLIQILAGLLLILGVWVFLRYNQVRYEAKPAQSQSQIKA